jgi:hypothetical protein
MDVELTKRWRATETVLERARVGLPQPAAEVRDEYGRAIAEYREYLSHNELGLAFESLRAAAALVPSRGEVWKDLIRAAEFMKLDASIPELQSCFEASASDPPVAGRVRSDG